MIAITGAAGFIGSQLALALQQDGSRPLLLVDHPLVAAKSRNMEPLRAHRFIEHRQFLSDLGTGKLSPEAIIHLGACSDTTEQSWDYLVENNLRYSQTLFNWCAGNASRFIYASSAATYGDGSAGFNDEADIRQLRPLNFYGRSKQEFDVWVEDQNRAGVKLPPQCVGLKFFNVFGPGEAHKGHMASMVFHGYNQITESDRIRLFKSHRPDFEDGGQLRDFIYVKDVVAVIAKFLLHPEISGLFNLGTGRARSFRDLATAVFSALGKPANIEYIPMPEILRGKYQYFTEATMSKLRNTGLTYEPSSLEASVADYVAQMNACT